MSDKDLCDSCRTHQPQMELVQNITAENRRCARTQRYRTDPANRQTSNLHSNQVQIHGFANSCNPSDVGLVNLWRCDLFQNVERDESTVCPGVDDSFDGGWRGRASWPAEDNVEHGHGWIKKPPAVVLDVDQVTHIQASVTTLRWSARSQGAPGESTRAVPHRLPRRDGTTPVGRCRDLPLAHDVQQRTRRVSFSTDSGCKR